MLHLTVMLLTVLHVPEVSVVIVSLGTLLVSMDSIAPLFVKICTASLALDLTFVEAASQPINLTRMESVRLIVH